MPGAVVESHQNEPGAHSLCFLKRFDKAGDAGTVDVRHLRQVQYDFLLLALSKLRGVVERTIGSLAATAPRFL